MTIVELVLNDIISQAKTEVSIAQKTSSGPCPMYGGPLVEESLVLCSQCECWVHYECAGERNSLAGDEPWTCAICKLTDLQVEVPRPILAYEDNQACIMISKIS